MKMLVLGLLVATAFAQPHEWEKSDYRDELHNKSGVRFSLASNEPGGGIEVVCSNGRLQAAWLLTEKVADSNSLHFSKGFTSSSVQSLVDVEYRRDNDAKPHTLHLPVSKDFHVVLLQEPLQSGTDMFLHGDKPRDVARGLEQLLYGPMGLGGGEWHRNKKSNNWARKLIVGISAYADSDSVFTFEVPDPSVVRESCAIN